MTCASLLNLRSQAQTQTVVSKNRLQSLSGRRGARMKRGPEWTHQHTGACSGSRPRLAAPSQASGAVSAVRNCVHSAAQARDRSIARRAGARSGTGPVSSTPMTPRPAGVCACLQRLLAPGFVPMGIHDTLGTFVSCCQRACLC